MISKLAFFSIFCAFLIQAQVFNHHNHPTTEEWIDAINYAQAPASTSSYKALFTSYNDDSRGNCKGGSNAAALDDNSWLWRTFGPGPCPACQGGKCKCKDGSSCPHAPNMWQCDATCVNWSPLICGPRGKLKGCTFTACGNNGCAKFFIQEGCQCKHPCNFCKTKKCSPSDPLHFDLCLHTSPRVCKGGQTCTGYVKDISCYTANKRPEWVDAEVEEWLADAQESLLAKA